MSRTAIVIAVEGLGRNMLGAYGGPWVATPALDDFAAHATVYDQFWLDTSDMPLLYRSMLYGWHAREMPNQIGQSVLAAMENAGMSSLLVHDAHHDIESFDQFSNAIAMEHGEPSDVLEPQDRCIANGIAQALAQWGEEESPAELLWIHSRGWNGRWDAPYFYRTALCSEDDPEPPTEQEPPSFRLEEDFDPDLLFGWTQAAAAQARVLDGIWDWIDSALESQSLREDCLVILMGLGGYPLGEHGIVGSGNALPFAELVHCPLIIRAGQGMPLGIRNDGLYQPSDLFATLMDWFHVKADSMAERRWSQSMLSPTESCESNRRCVVASSNDQGYSMRIGHWSSVWHTPDDSSKNDDGSMESSDEVSPSLYLLPEDRWQQNDVASRAAEIVSELCDFRQAFDTWLRSNASAELKPVPSALLTENP